MAYKKVGSLWKKKSEKTGKTYLSGKIKLGEEEISITVWLNDKGDNPRRPDYVIQAQVEDEPVPPTAEPDGFIDGDANEDGPAF